MRVKEQNEKADLKLTVHKTKIMASSHISSQQKDGKKWKLTDFIFLGCKTLWTLTAAMKLKDACFLEKKGMPNLDSILKSRDITNKGP